jgi:predicted nucleic acid-binding protein
MGLILDSTILIAAERGVFDLDRFIEAEAPMDTVYISSVTASELLHGCFRSVPPRRAKREAFVEGTLASIPILSFDLSCARRHAELWAFLESGGNRIGAHDMQIAATGLRYGLEIATLNESEFQRVPGLKLANARPYLKTS